MGWIVWLWREYECEWDKDDSDQEIYEEDNEEIDEEAEEALDSDNVIEWELSVRLIEFIIIMGWRKLHVQLIFNVFTQKLFYLFLKIFLLNILRLVAFLSTH